MMTMARSFVALSAMVSLAACGGKQVDYPLNEAEAAALGRAPDPTKVLTERWSKLFSDPAKVVSAANDMGYQVKPYAATGGAPAFAATGVTQVLPDAKATVTVTTNFKASGPSASEIDLIQFDFTINDVTRRDTKKERDAQKKPKRLIDGFLGRFDVGQGDEAIIAMRNDKAATIKRYAATMTITPVPDPAHPKARTIIVTFTKAGAAKAAAPQTQS